MRLCTVQSAPAINVFNSQFDPVDLFRIYNEKSHAIHIHTIDIALKSNAIQFHSGSERVCVGVCDFTENRLRSPQIHQ